MPPLRAVAVLSVCLMMVACRDGLMDQQLAAPPPLATLDCVARLHPGELACRSSLIGLPAGVNPAIFGQAQVKLASSNVSYDTASLIFAADITVQNLLSEVLGTPDGETMTGIEVFFDDGPRATSFNTPYDTGTVTIRNADGHRRFTRDEQPFFQYETILEPTEVSGSRTWEWEIPRSVATFAFTLKVSAYTPGEFLQPQLVALVSEGVVGTPVSGSVGMGAVDSVPYAFAVSPGYHNLSVRLDGRAVAESGTVRIDSIHVLEASADPIVTLPSAYQPLLALAQAVHTAGDKVAAYEAYLAAADSLGSAVGLEVATQILQKVEFLAFEPETQFATELELDEAFANRTFGSSQIAETTAHEGFGVRANQGSSSHAPPDSTVFVYVNGAYTSLLLTNRSLFITEGLIRTASFSYPGAWRSKVYYNRTYSAQYDSSANRRIFCAKDYVLNSPLLGPNSMTQRFLTCRGIILSEGVYGNDYVEAARQVVNTMRDVSQVAEADAIVLADTLETIVEKGHKVVVVAHSQGNLMAQQAVRTLRERDPSWESGRSLCIGAVAMGAPLSDGWYVRDEELAGVSVRGDIILGIPELGIGGWNTFPLSWNAWSDSLEADLADLGGLQYVPVLRDPLISRIYLKWATTVHHPTISYLGEPRSAAVIQTAITNVHDAVARRCGPRPVIAPRGGSLREGETLQLRASLAVPARVGGPLAEPVAWTSLEPDAATVDSTGLVQAVRAGRTARIVATRTGVQQADTVSVSVYLDTFDGMWTGTWNNGNLFGQPFASGPMYLTLAGSGGSVSLTYQNGRFDGPIPAYIPQDSAFGRAAHLTVQNAGTPLEMRTVYVYFHEDLGEWTQHPYQMRAHLQLTSAGTRLVGTLTDCRVESTCQFGFRPVGTITLNRVW